jgi:hypothetical protein
MSTPSRHVIFRSRGCRTCRARKVKCDQTHPFCQRCAGSGLKCRGYSEPTTFLHENPQSTDLSLSAEPRALPYPAESKHIAFLAKCLAFETLGDKKGYAWLRNGLCASEDRSYLLFTSSRCLAYVFYGRHFKQHRTITDGMDGYGKMLRVLRGELSKPMAVTTGDLLQVIVTSILVESVIAPTMGNFNFGGLHAHIDGLARILQMRGPKAFQQKLELQPFQVCRCYIIGRAINTRTPTFLAEAQWKALPWQYEEKGSLMELWDIL